MPNPTLNETNIVQSNCFFKNLEVEGRVTIKNVLNDIPLDPILGDVIYKTDLDPTCVAHKTFEKLQANIRLTSNLLNDVDLGDYMTLDTDQAFEVDHLDASVWFSKLKLDGLYDFINVTELDVNAVKTFGDQVTGAELVVEDGSWFDANVLDVQNSINGIDVEDFIRLDEDIVIDGDLTLNDLSANEVIVGGDILGEGTLNGQNLKDLSSTCLSRSKEQIIEQPVYIESGVIRGTFDANLLNGFDFQTILKNLLAREREIDLLKKDQVVVQSITVEGSVNVENIHGFNLEELKANAIWLDRPNVILSNLQFFDGIVVDGNLSVELMNGVLFNDLVGDVVLKTDAEINIFGTTIFREDIQVGTIETQTLNQQPTAKILTKNYSERINVPVNIFGDVTVRNVEVEESFDGIPIEDIVSVYQFDAQRQCHVLNGSVLFDEPTIIESLVLNGGVNGVPNAEIHLNDIVLKNRPMNVTGLISFTGPVQFGGNLFISEIDQMHVREFFENVLYANQLQPIEISTEVVFEGPTQFNDVQILGNFTSPTINNCNIDDWLQDAIRTDQPQLLPMRIVIPEGGFRANELKTDYLNGQLAANILTRHTPQRFLGTVTFGEIISKGTIDVKGRVSGFHLPTERENTLMV